MIKQRRRRYNWEQKQAILAEINSLMLKNCGFKKACKVFGIHWSMFYRWKQQLEVKAYERTNQASISNTSA